MTQEQETTAFEQWCIVELMGHQQIAGKVSEKALFGTSLMRVDVPETAKRAAFTKFYGGSAIYSVTPVEQSVAVAMAEALNEAPIQEWRLKTVEPSRQLPERVADDDDDWDDGPDEVEDRFDEDPDDDDPDEFEEELDDDGLPDVETDKAQAALWAQSILEKPFVIFDTETTGLWDSDEIIQIGIIDQDGNTVFESLIKPSIPIENSHIHGITDDMVKDAPTLADVYEQVKAALTGGTVVIYNADFDLKMLRQSLSKHDLATFSVASTCAMTKYAQFAGDWNDYHGNYRWQKLADAVAAFGKKHSDFGTKAHDACTDARATLAVIQGMAAWKPEPVPVKNPVADKDKF